jgi:hypothetical protein
LPDNCFIIIYAGTLQAPPQGIPIAGSNCIASILWNLDTIIKERGK